MAEKLIKIEELLECTICLEKFKNQLVRNQVNYSLGTDQPKNRLARQLPNCYEFS